MGKGIIETLTGGMGSAMESAQNALNEQREGLDKTRDKLVALKKSMDENPKDFNVRQSLDEIKKIVFEDEFREAKITNEAEKKEKWATIQYRIERALVGKTTELNNINDFVNDISGLTGFKALTDPDAEPGFMKKWLNKAEEMSESIFNTSFLGVVGLLREMESLWGGDKDEDGNPKEGMFAKLYRKVMINTGEHQKRFKAYKKEISLPTGYELAGNYSEKDEVELTIKKGKDKVGTLKFNPSAEQITLVINDKTYTGADAAEINEYLTAENLGTPAPKAGETVAQAPVKQEALSTRDQELFDKFKPMTLDAGKIFDDLKLLKRYSPQIQGEEEIDTLIGAATHSKSPLEKVISAITNKLGKKFDVRLADLYLQKERSTDDVDLMIKIINGKKEGYKKLKTAEDFRNFLMKSHQKKNLTEALES